jgi:hypothetical protein
MTVAFNFISERTVVRYSITKIMKTIQNVAIIAILPSIKWVETTVNPLAYLDGYRTSA